MDRASETKDLGLRERLPIRWPSRILGPKPGLEEVNLIGWGMFVAFLVVPVCVILWLHLTSASGSLRSLHSDFVYFYGIGRIVTEYSLMRVYDPGLQQK